MDKDSAITYFLDHFDALLISGSVCSKCRVVKDLLFRKFSSVPVGIVEADSATRDEDVIILEAFNVQSIPVVINLKTKEKLVGDEITELSLKELLHVQ